MEYDIILYDILWCSQNAICLYNREIYLISDNSMFVALNRRCLQFLEHDCHILLIFLLHLHVCSCLSVEDMRVFRSFKQGGICNNEWVPTWTQSLTKGEIRPHTHIHTHIYIYIYIYTYIYPRDLFNNIGDNVLFDTCVSLAKFRYCFYSWIPIHINQHTQCRWFHYARIYAPIYPVTQWLNVFQILTRKINLLWNILSLSLLAHIKLITPQIGREHGWLTQQNQWHWIAVDRLGGLICFVHHTMDNYTPLICWIDIRNYHIHISITSQLEYFGC